MVKKLIKFKKELYNGYLWTILDVNCDVCGKLIEERSIPQHQEEDFFQNKVFSGDKELDNQLTKVMKMSYNGGFRGSWLRLEE